MKIEELQYRENRSGNTQPLDYINWEFNCHYVLVSWQVARLGSWHCLGHCPATGIRVASEKVGKPSSYTSAETARKSFETRLHKLGRVWVCNFNLKISTEHFCSNAHRLFAKLWNARETFLSAARFEQHLQRSRPDIVVVEWSVFPRMKEILIFHRHIHFTRKCHSEIISLYWSRS